MRVVGCLSASFDQHTYCGPVVGPMLGFPSSLMTCWIPEPATPFSQTLSGAMKLGTSAGGATMPDFTITWCLLKKQYLGPRLVRRVSGARGRVGWAQRSNR